MEQAQQLTNRTVSRGVATNNNRHNATTNKRNGETKKEKQRREHKSRQNQHDHRQHHQITKCKHDGWNNDVHTNIRTAKCTNNYTKNNDNIYATTAMQKRSPLPASPNARRCASFVETDAFASTHHTTPAEDTQRG